VEKGTRAEKTMVKLSKVAMKKKYERIEITCENEQVNVDSAL
jgi:hypothetical protein